MTEEELRSLFAATTEPEGPMAAPGMAWANHRETLLEATAQALISARTVLDLLDAVVADLRREQEQAPPAANKADERPTAREGDGPIPLSYDERDWEAS
ncbi:MAG: hypothetical protein AAGK32_16125 [Actinomycetota bacterium]